MKTKTKLLIAGLVISHAFVGAHFYSKGRESGREEVLFRLRDYVSSIYEKANRTYYNLSAEQKDAFYNLGNNVNLLIDYLRVDRDDLNQRLDVMYELEEQLIKQSTTLRGKRE